jgi:predicted alpha-1,2-mannosidase
MVESTFSNSSNRSRPVAEKQKQACRQSGWQIVCSLAFVVLIGLAVRVASSQTPDPSSLVNPIIGTANGGNDFPGAARPFGMVAWSPEEPYNRPRPRVEGVPGSMRDDRGRPAAPGGYEYTSTKIRGFSLTHLMGTGCAGASGDVPFLPFVGSVTTSPSADLLTNTTYAVGFSHDDESAQAGYYKVKLANGVTVELTATPRTGAGQFTYPASSPALMLVRASDSETGSSDAHITIDAAHRTISGSVTSGNFCGYLGTEDRRSYYTLYFVARFDSAFTSTGTWQDADVRPGTTEASGGTTYGTQGFVPAGKGSGAWVALDTAASPVVHVRVGISYVSERNAEANLRAEDPPGMSFAAAHARAHAAWNQILDRIRITGGTSDQRIVFYTALYHSLLGENLYSDVDGEYFGMDQKVHKVVAPQQAQYATFSGWDVYRSQLQLVTLVDPAIGSDIAQSLLNQADQKDGEWDRWTHNSGETHVMNGDPADPAIADILAFGGSRFNVKAAYASLLKAATVPTANDLTRNGCPVECIGQRPSLDLWMKLHYIPTDGNAWGGAADTLEDVTADFALSELARRMHDEANQKLFLARAQYWKNIFNPNATPDGGYIQNRNADGSWQAFNPARTTGFVEGSAAQYVWMVPFNEQRLFDLMGGRDKANARLDSFFHKPDGSWAVTESGGLHAELNNEPSIETPWLYDFSGQPWKTQSTVRQVLNTIWTNKPNGMPGNDDLGEMSSWFVWSALGLYPEIPARAELVLGSPLFPEVQIRRATAPITIKAAGAATDAPYVQSLRVNGVPSTKTWLSEDFLRHGGTLAFTLSTTPNKDWGTGAKAAPPSFAPAN